MNHWLMLGAACNRGSRQLRLRRHTALWVCVLCLGPVARAAEEVHCNAIDTLQQRRLDEALGSTTAADWLAGAQGRARREVRLFDVGTDFQLAWARRPSFAGPAPAAAPGALLAPFAAVQALSVGVVSMQTHVFRRRRLPVEVSRLLPPVTSLDFLPLSKWLGAPNVWGALNLLERIPPGVQQRWVEQLGLSPGFSLDAISASPGQAATTLQLAVLGGIDAPVVAPEHLARLYTALARGGLLNYEWSRGRWLPGELCNLGPVPFDNRSQPYAVLPLLPRKRTPAARTWIALSADVPGPELGHGPRAWRVAIWPVVHPRYLLLLSVEQGSGGAADLRTEADELLERLMATIPMPEVSRPRRGLSMWD